MTPDTLGHYEVIGLLGKGGMGEVYRARDTKLDREVALKILPEDIGRDPERLARFRREAKVLASLNHPSIAAIHGLEEDQGKMFLVLELAEGEDLSTVIERGASTIDEVISVARQLADGLEQAHERGVVHRDLKPANVKLSSDGRVKILDFGLARAYAGESAAEGDIGMSPTITAAMTQAGTILGTAAYMSPEQARGAEVDRRADIWAFGVVLFEMLTGKRLFHGETISDTLAEVLKTEPDFEQLPDTTPVALQWLIDRCLQKRPSRRLRDIGEARILLETDLDQVPASTMSQPGVVVIEKPRWVVPAILGTIAVALAIGFGAARVTTPEPDAAESIHAALLPPPGARIQTETGGHIAISPDGSRVTFAARDSTDADMLWVRRLDSPAAHALSGTSGASYPFWSPDGSKIGFFAEGRMKKIDAGGGVATSICEAPYGRGGAWLEDDRIIFAHEVRDQLKIVPASGGTPLVATTLDSFSWSHRWPASLPGTDKFLYLDMGQDTSRLIWRSIDSTDDQRILLDPVERGSYGNGQLFFGRDGALWARPFDPHTGTFLGSEVLVEEAVVTATNFGSGAYSISRDGTIVYVAGEQTSVDTMVLLDAEGAELDRIVHNDLNAEDVNLSPDGRYLAYSKWPRDGSGNSDVWIRDLQRGSESQLTQSERADDPVWGPQGDRIAYSRQGDLVVRSTVGARDILLELEFDDDFIPHDWSRDGQLIVGTIPADGRDILIVPVEDPASWYPLVSGTGNHLFPAFSPDGRWVTYMYVTINNPRVFLSTTEAGGGTWPVTTGFGVQPRFNDDGSIITWIDEQGLQGTTVTFTERGPEFSDDRLLMRASIQGGRPNTHQYDLVGAPDRVFMQIDPSAGTSRESVLELLLNWRARAVH